MFQYKGPDDLQEKIILEFENREELELLAWSISDLLCWTNGFESAKGDDYTCFYNKEHLRSLNSKIKEVLRKIK